MEEVIGQFTGYLADAVLAGVLALIAAAAARFGIEFSAARRARVEHFARLGIQYAEERARNVLANGVRTLQPEEKLATAVAFLLERVPRVSREEAEATVKAILPDVRRTLQTGAAEVGKAIRTTE